jgi:hypothetical protein
VLSETQLREAVERVNQVLAANGHKQTPLSVEGRADYMSIAMPYQTDTQ